MKLATPRALESRFGARVSLHTFRWGAHIKLRKPGGRWFHLVVRWHRGSALGQTKARRALWIGWWRSEKFPVFPQQARDEERAA